MHTLRTKGAVSRAFVTDKKEDTIVRTERSGIKPSSTRTRSTTTPVHVLNLWYDTRSPVSYAQYGLKGDESALPALPPRATNSLAAVDHTGVLWVTDEVFANTKVGDVLVVVNSSYNRSAPKLFADVKAFDDTSGWPWIALCLVLAAMLALFGRRISKGGQATGPGNG
ncbi:MAG: hypothetical protein ACOVN4_16430 [Bosea sp. (in: a-proteobacteria)]